MPRKISRKGLIKKNWQLVRMAVIQRAGGICEICKKIAHEVDHCFSRSNRELFYEIKNLTLLCSFCHSYKTHRQYDFDLRVYELVQEREGTEAFEALRKVSKRRGGFSKWALMSYHEEINNQLTGRENS